MANKELFPEGAMQKEVKSGIMQGARAIGFDVSLTAIARELAKLASEMGSFHRILEMQGGGIEKLSKVNLKQIETWGFVRTDMLKLGKDFAAGGVFDRLTLKAGMQAQMLMRNEKSITSLIKAHRQSDQIFGDTQEAIDSLTSEAFNLAKTYQRDSEKLLQALNQNTDQLVKTSLALGPRHAANLRQAQMKAAAIFGTELEDSIGSLVKTYLTPGLKTMTQLQQIGLQPDQVKGGGMGSIVTVLDALQTKLGPMQDPDAFGEMFEAMQTALNIPADVLPLLLAHAQGVDMEKQEQVFNILTQMEKSRKDFDVHFKILKDTFTRQMMPHIHMMAEVLPKIANLAEYFIPLVIARWSVMFLKTTMHYVAQKAYWFRALGTFMGIKNQDNLKFTWNRTWRNKMLQLALDTRMINAKNLQVNMSGELRKGAQTAAIGGLALAGRFLMRIGPWVMAAGMAYSLFKMISGKRTEIMGELEAGGVGSGESEKLAQWRTQMASLQAQIRDGQNRTAVALEGPNRNPYLLQHQTKVLATETLRVLTKQLAISEGMDESLANMPAANLTLLQAAQTAAAGTTNTLLTPP